MLKLRREEEIIQLVNQTGAVTVRELAERFEVTEVTIRRDLQDLESRNLLLRTHGGAIRSENFVESSHRSGISASPVVMDALILSPVQHRVAHTLRERALRHGIPILAESVPFEGAIYLGPDNYGGAQSLGNWTGHYVHHHFDTLPHVLCMSAAMPNGQERQAGFEAGLRQSLGSDGHIISVDGQSFYDTAYRATQDALRVHPEINVVYGINDDMILGGLRAMLDAGRNPESFIVVGVGGEGQTIFDVLRQRGPFKACLALFPEIVGRQGIEGTARLWAGEPIDQIITPHAVVTADNLADYYMLVDEALVLRPGAVDELEQTRWDSPTPDASGKSLSFVIHFRTHEWYQNVARAMQQRATELRIGFSIEDVIDDLRAEINDLRRLIGKMAASYVDDGDTIFLDSGTTTTYMAHFLHRRQGLTVITNSITVFHSLQNNSEIKLILTGGELHNESQSLVGRGATLYLRELRASKAFIIAGGVSSTFGISGKTQQEAEVRRAMIDCAREVVVLADHTVMGADSDTYVTGLDQVDTIITDSGVRAEDLLEFNQLGIAVMVAGDMERYRRQKGASSQ